MGRIRYLVFVVAAFAIVATPSVASAASSGGWNNLGPAGVGNANYGAIEGKVIVLERSGTDLYVGGSFNDAGDVEAADRIAKWNGSAWSAVCPTLTGDGPTGDVYSIAVDTQNGRVYAGGSFQDVGGDVNADGLVVCRNGAWHSLGGVSFPNNVTALEIVGRTMYIGGGFLNAAALPTGDYVVGYNLDGGGFFALDDGVGGNAFINGPNDIVADGAGSVYMAGGFTDVDQIAEADFVVHYDGAQHWSALGSGPPPTHGAIQHGGAFGSGQVRGLTVANNGDLYAVGDFIDVTGTGEAGDKIARWNGASWSSVGGSSFFSETSTVSLRDVVVDGSTVIVVGNFSTIHTGETLPDGVAAFVDGDWTNVGTNAAGTDGPLTGPNPALLDLELVGTRLYIGGLDQDIGGGLLNDSIAFFRLHQPDALIKTTGSYVGNNVYNASGKSQTKSRSANQGATTTFTIRVSNDGLAAEDIELQGPGSQSGFTATYKRGATDITAQVVAGSYTLNDLAPGATVDITLSVKVGNGVANGVTKSWKVTATSSGGSVDAVKAKVTVT